MSDSGCFRRSEITGNIPEPKSICRKLNEKSVLNQAFIKNEKISV